MMYMTPKRLRWNFHTAEAAEVFAEQKRQTGAHDVTVITRVNVEDKARGMIARVEGADVCWTEYTSD
jgi:hypothetical protein